MGERARYWHKKAAEPSRVLFESDKNLRNAADVSDGVWGGGRTKIGSSLCAHLLFCVNPTNAVEARGDWATVYQEDLT